MIINTIRKSFFIVLTLCICCHISGQQTMGVNVYDKDATSDGYIFFSPMDYTSAYLIDNCGFLVNSWDRQARPGLGGHLTESGLMLRTNKVSTPQYFQASTGGNLELVDWDNNTVWSSDFNEFEYIQHHDAVLMPNGNIIYIGWERINTAQQIAFGRDPDDLSQAYLWGEFIQEIKPIGNSDYEVVWEWHLQDHFVQDYDPSKLNYGVVKDEIGKVDINYLGPANFSDDDWWHCNALDYNPALDHILVNSRSNGEMWIIDHSTTTAEAAGNTGGNSNKGGELLYRWGNPAAYNSGVYSDLRMYGSHGHYWIPEGFPNAGKIMYFNNGDERPGGYYSTVEMIDPQFENGEYLKNDNNRYFPLEPEIVYKASPDPFDFSSRYLSNAKQLINGNVFINEGGDGRLFEIDENGNIVWQYFSPIDLWGPNTQGEYVSSSYIDIFRAYKYEPEYAAFVGKDLTPGDLIEGDSEYNLCKNVSTENEIIKGFQMSYDFGSAILTLENTALEDLQIQIVNINGKLISNERLSVDYLELDLNHLETGIYVVKITSPQSPKGISKKIVRI